MYDKSKETEKFILTPASDILNQATVSMNALSDGVELFPAQEYLLQSVFLRTTGFIEQKLKEICWVVGTDDREYRYRQFLSGRWDLGECSDYSSKGKIYKALYQRSVASPECNILEQDWDILKTSVINESRDETLHLLAGLKIGAGLAHEKNFFKKVSQDFCAQCIMGEEELFVNCDNCSKKNTCNCSIYQLAFAERNKKKPENQNSTLQVVFQQSYEDRNRIAHNIRSGRNNNPSLTMLSDKRNLFHSFHYKIFINILIDRIFVELYKIYLENLRARE